MAKGKKQTRSSGPSEDEEIQDETTEDDESEFETEDDEEALGRPVSVAVPAGLAVRDESGSDIPATNLVQPPYELPPAPSHESATTDTAITDADETVRDAAEGTSTDWATREEEDNEAQGDVEVLTVPESDGGEEYWPPITVEDWVVLGQDSFIPERLQGRRAAVIAAPRMMIPVGEEANVWLTVRTRDEVNATLNVPLSMVTLDKGGRGGPRG